MWVFVALAAYGYVRRRPQPDEAKPVGTTGGLLLPASPPVNDRGGDVQKRPVQADIEVRREIAMQTPKDAPQPRLVVGT